MRRWMQVVFIAVFCASVLTGCAELLSWIGVTTDPDTGVTTHDAGGGPAGSIAGMFLPGAGTALGIVGWFTTLVKGRKWKKIARAGIRGVNRARQLYTQHIKVADGTVVEMISVKNLMDVMANMQEEEDIRKKAVAEIHHIEGKTKSAA